MKTLEITDRRGMEAILEACPLCYVGMADSDGTPYVLPMNFGYRDGFVYLHSASDGRSIEILGRNPRVCLTFTAGDELVCQHPEVACSYRMRSRSVLAWGSVEFESDPARKTEALDVLMRHYSPRPFRYAAPAVANVRIWVVKLDRMTAKAFGVPHGDKPLPGEIRSGKKPGT